MCYTDGRTLTDGNVPSSSPLDVWFWNMIAKALLETPLIFVCCHLVLDQQCTILHFSFYWHTFPTNKFNPNVNFYISFQVFYVLYRRTDTDGWKRSLEQPFGCLILEYFSKGVTRNTPNFCLLPFSGFGIIFPYFSLVFSSLLRSENIMGDEHGSGRWVQNGMDFKKIITMTNWKGGNRLGWWQWVILYKHCSLLARIWRQQSWLCCISQFSNLLRLTFTFFGRHFNSWYQFPGTFALHWVAIAELWLNEF